MDTQDFSNTIDFKRLTAKAKSSIKSGFEIAKENKSKEYQAIHLFTFLISDKGGILEEIINKIGIDMKPTLNSLQKAIDELPKISEGENTVFSNQIKEIINNAYEVSKDLKQVFVGTEHLFMAMFKMQDLKFITDMNKVGVDYAVLKKSLESLGNYAMLNMENGQNQSTGIPGMPDLPDFGSNNDDVTQYLVDMNELAEDGRFSAISGRDKEIKRLIHILSRKTKNNPILVGDAGVGKTAIVEGFVNAILEKNVPSSFFNKQVLSVDIAAIVAGARLRGDVEERLTDIINYAIDEGNVILFIDEIHNIVGAGSVGSKDTMDIANILKPYLTNSDLTVIGATTADEYTSYFENDAALNRRFQPIDVEELDKESAKKVVLNLKKDFENYHRVKIKNEAIEEAVELSSEFIKYRYLPDKVIDIIDEACATVKIGREIAIEPELSKLGEELLKVQKQKEKAVKSKNMDKAAELKDKEEKIVDDISEVIEGKKTVKKKYPKIVTTDLIKKIIVDWTKIPIAASDITDKTLKELDKNIKERIVGQDRVVDKVAMAIKRSHIGLYSNKRPLASFLFLGPTGVGKTELAKTLAKELFGDENLMFRVDMSEFMEMHSVAKLIGSPPGYVGHDEGGQLTKFVKRKPYSVVLFDEIEKAHPDSLNLLLQLLEEGEVTDSKGVKVSFSNTIIVMTSNIGAEEVSTNKRLGFDIVIDDEDKDGLEEVYEDMRDKIMEQLRINLRPELINRIDLIDVFRGLNKEDCLAIARNQIDELKLQLLKKGLVLEVDDEVAKKVNEEGYSKEFGGRNIRRKIQEIVENGLAEYLLNNDIQKKKGEMLKLSAKVEKNGEVEFERS